MDDASTTPDSLGLELSQQMGLDTRVRWGAMREQLFGRKPDPTRVGRYIIKSRLGFGGMGTVYRAYDEELDREVAIKLLDAGGTAVLHEARAMAQLAHPNVVQVFDVGELDDQVFVAMELVDGQTLRQWFARQTHRGRWRTVVEKMIQAGEGLCAAHAANLVHRDFKPNNVMVGDDGRARVLDFGLAVKDATKAAVSVAGTEPPNQGTSHKLGGTVPYMAPEQLSLGQSDTRSDQFSFFVTVFEGLYGQRPFVADNNPELILRIVEGRQTPPPADVKIPRWLTKVLARGLSPDPDRRWPTMRAALDELSRGLSQRRKWIVGACAVAVAVGFGAYALSNRPMCDGTGQPIDEAWSMASQQRLEQALVASGASYTEHLAPRVSDTLSQRAALWQEVAANACEQHQLGRVSDEIYTLKLACLSRLHQHFSALVDVLSEGTPEISERALQAALRLEPASLCDDVDDLVSRAGKIPKPAPAVAQQVAGLTTQLQRLRALHDAEVGPAGVLLGRELYASAKQLAYAPLLAEVGLWYGRLQILVGDLAGASESLTAAVVAAEAGSHDRAKVAAVTSLVKLMAEAQSRHQEAKRWAQLAQATLQRNGTPQGVEYAELLSSRAAVDASLEDYPAALDRYQRAFEIGERVLGANHPTTNKLLSNYATVLEDMGELELAAAKLRQGLANVEQTLGADHPALAVFLNNLGVAERKLGQTKAAREHLERARELLRAAKLEHGDRYAEVLGNLGTVHQDLGELDRALDLYHQASAVIQATGPGRIEVAKFATNAANVLQQQGAYTRAIANHKLALATLEQLDAPASARALVLFNLGDVELDAGNLLAAGQAFERSGELAKQGNNPLAQADAWYGFGRLALKQGDCPTAAAHLSRAADVHRSRAGYSLEAAQVDGLLAHTLIASDQATARAQVDNLLARALSVLPEHTPAARDARRLREHTQQHGSGQVPCGEMFR